MSQYEATIAWQRGDQLFVDDSYSRGHELTFDGGLSIPASSSPGVVPLPWKNCTTERTNCALLPTRFSPRSLWISSHECG
jgi:hypothetical protein